MGSQRARSETRRWSEVVVYYSHKVHGSVSGISVRPVPSPPRDAQSLLKDLPLGDPSRRSQVPLHVCRGGVSLLRPHSDATSRNRDSSKDRQSLLFKYPSL